MPITIASVGLCFGAAFGWAGLLVAGLVTTGCGAWGYVLYKQHGVQKGALRQAALEEMALDIYRRHEGDTLTKEDLVRDHRLHPNQADRILTWLEAQELVHADWSDLEGPVVYRRRA